MVQLYDYHLKTLALHEYNLVSSEKYVSFPLFIFILLGKIWLDFSLKRWSKNVVIQLNSDHMVIMGQQYTAPLSFHGWDSGRVKPPKERDVGN